MDNKCKASFLIQKQKKLFNSLQKFIARAVLGHTLLLFTIKFDWRSLLPPVRAPFGVKWSSKYFPNLLELSLITVWAFPSASIRGLTWRIFSSKVLFPAWKTKQNKKKQAYTIWSNNWAKYFVLKYQNVPNFLKKKIFSLWTHLPKFSQVAH